MMYSTLLQTMRAGAQQAAAGMCRSQLHTSAYQPGAISRQLLKLVGTVGPCRVCVHVICVHLLSLHASFSISDRRSIKFPGTIYPPGAIC